VWGGALAGGFGGLVYGVLSGATSALIQSGAAAFLQDVEVVPATLGSGIGLSVSVGATIVGGVIFGALGSGAYSMWQRRKQAQSLSRGASILLGGCATVVFSCAVIFSCALLALSADAAYWSNRRGNGPLAQEVAPSASGASESELDRLRAGLEALPAGNAESGEQVLASNACHACHSLEAGVRLVGPSLAGIGTTAATRKQGYPAELYLYESLVYPEAFAVEGYPSGLMPAEVVKQLSQQQLADLIAFLMTQ
jgi:cytochrome c551/c552